MMNNIAIFVDVQNIYYTTKQAFAKQFDYRKFWQKISSKGKIISAYAYAIERNEHDSVKDSQIKFQDALKHIGFDVKLKPYLQRNDGSAKGDWDVGITIDIMETAPHVDTIILLSGDGDFDLVLLKINQLYNTRSQVYGVESLTAKSLIDSATNYHPIDKDLLL